MIGILNIQGSVAEHLEALRKLDVEVVLVKKPEDLKGLDGLILPGGESTTIGKLMDFAGLKKEIKQSVKRGMAIWGTCAGAVLMAQLGLINIEVERNAYGRQQESFETDVDFDGKNIPAIFIRAPKILLAGDDCEVLAKHDDDIVAVREEKMMVTTFHPELTDDLTVHRYFVAFLGL
jgi:pyridoxal 5'-phosphate synthase pdxT subunit